MEKIKEKKDKFSHIDGGIGHRFFWFFWCPCLQMTFNVEQEVHDVLNRLKAIVGKYHVLYSYALYTVYN